jgi:hypothetical protein
VTALRPFPVQRQLSIRTAADTIRQCDSRTVHVPDACLGAKGIDGVAVETAE